MPNSKKALKKLYTKALDKSQEAVKTWLLRQGKSIDHGD